MNAVKESRTTREIELPSNANGVRPADTMKHIHICNLFALRGPIQRARGPTMYARNDNNSVFACLATILCAAVYVSIMIHPVATIPMFAMLYRVIYRD